MIDVSAFGGGGEAAAHGDSFLSDVTAARTRYQSTRDDAALAMLISTLEEACTTICIGGEFLVRGIDAVAAFDELSACVSAADSSIDALTLALRAVAAVLDMVPRAAHRVVGHELFTQLLEIAHGVLQLQACDPLAEEIVRIVSILSFEQRDHMVERGAVPLVVSYARMLHERYRQSILRSLIQLAGGLRPAAAAADMAIATELLLAVGELTANAYADTPAGQPPNAKATDTLVFCAAIGSQVADTACVTEAAAAKLMRNAGEDWFRFVNRAIADSVSAGERGERVAASAQAAMVEMLMATPRAATAGMLEHGTLSVIASRLSDVATVRMNAGDHAALLAGGALGRGSTSNASSSSPTTNPRGGGRQPYTTMASTVSLVDLLRLAIPPCPDDVADAARIAVPSHPWEWEDDFRNHNAFPGATVEFLENEYQYQRRVYAAASSATDGGAAMSLEQQEPSSKSSTRGRRPVVVIPHASRLTIIAMENMRQGSTMDSSRPVFRAPLPSHVAFREPSSVCTCSAGLGVRREPASTDHPLDSDSDDIDDRRTGRDGTRGGDDSDHHDSDSADDDDQDGTAQPSQTVCQRLCPQLRGGASSSAAGDSDHPSAARSGRRGSVPRHRRTSVDGPDAFWYGRHSSQSSGRRSRRRATRLQPSTRSADVREAQQLSTDFARWLANEGHVISAGLVSALVPALLSVLRSTVDEDLVSTSMQLLVRILHVVSLAAPSASSVVAVRGLAPAITSAVTVTLRSSAASAADDDQASRVLGGTSATTHATHQQHSTGNSPFDRHRRPSWQQQSAGGVHASNVAVTQQTTHGLTRRGQVIASSCSALSLLSRIVGAEHLIEPVRRARMETAVLSLAEHLSHIVNDIHMDGIPMPSKTIADDDHHHDLVAKPSDTNIATEDNNCCLVHRRERHEAARLLAVVEPVAALLGSAASSPTAMVADNSLDVLTAATAALSSPSISLEEKWDHVAQVNDIVAAHPPSIGALAEMHPGFLRALAAGLREILSAVTRMSSEGAAAAPLWWQANELLRRSSALRSYLWSKVDALVEPVNPSRLFAASHVQPAFHHYSTQSQPQALQLLLARERAALSSSAARPSPAAVAVFSPQPPGEAERAALTERMTRALVLRLEPVSSTTRAQLPSALASSVLDVQLSEIHVTVSPLSSLDDLAALVKQRLLARPRWLASMSEDGGNPPGRATSPESAPVSETDDGRLSLADPDGAASASPAEDERPTHPKSGDDLALVVVFPSGQAVECNRAVAVIDALFHYHPLASGLRAFVEAPLQRKRDIASAFDLWRGVLPLRYMCVSRSALSQAKAFGDSVEHLLDQPKLMQASVVRDGPPPANEGDDGGGHGARAPTGDEAGVETPSGGTKRMLSVGGAPLGMCCRCRVDGHTVCSPLHFLHDAVADAVDDTVATVEALEALEALVRTTATPLVETFRLSSAVFAALRRHSAAFQARLFAHFRIESALVDALLASRRVATGPLIDDGITPRSPIAPGETRYGAPLDGSYGSTKKLHSTRTSRSDVDVTLKMLAAAPSLVPIELRLAAVRGLCVTRPVAISGSTSPKQPARDGAPAKIRVVVEREQIVRTARMALRQHVPPTAVLDVSFAGEAGTGPGPCNEFFAAYCAHFTAAGSWLWDDARSANGLFPRQPYDPQPQPDTSSAPVSFDGVTREAAWEDLGRLVAVCLLEGRQIPLDLHPAVLRALTDRPGRAVGFTEASEVMRSIDPGVERSLAAIEAVQCESDFEALALVWVVPGTECELRDGGSDSAVEWSDRDVFTDAVRKFWRSDALQPFLMSFCHGVADVVAVPALALFSATELVLLIRGVAGKLWASAEAFMSATRCDHGYTRDSQPVALLAECVAGMSADEQRLFLRFVSGRGAIPSSGLDPRLTIVRRDIDALPTGDSPPATNNNADPTGATITSVPGVVPDPAAAGSEAGIAFADETPPRLRQPQALVDASLPTVNTCFHYLKLPPYSTAAVLEQRLRFAMTEGQGAFLMS